MTDISVSTTPSQVENRSWLRSPHGTEPGTNPNATLLVSLFTKGTHYPNGYIPSGIVLGKVTSTGAYGPYDPSASDGRQTAAGHLFSSVNVGPNTTRVASGLVRHGFVNPAKLPLQSGTGSLDTAARTALSLIDYSA